MATDVLGKLLKLLAEVQLRIARRRQRAMDRRRARSRPGVRRASESFRKLRRGELSLAAYLDEKIEQALIPLQALLHPSDLRFVRSILLEKIEVDPVLSTMVARIGRMGPPIRR